MVTRTNTTSGQNLVETIEDFRNVIRYQNVSNSTFDLGKHWQLWMGTLIVLVVVVAPQGLMGLLRPRSSSNH